MSRAGPGGGLTRRRFGALTAALGLAPTFAANIARADTLAPLIIAEGGTAAERPEDTRSAYDLAIDQGADFLQANLVLTKDGVLIARRDLDLGATTDIAAHPEFASRRGTRTVEGAEVAGWFADDFTLAEIKTLACRERQPTLRPQNTRYDGKEPVLTLSEVLAIARAGCVRTARVVGVMPRMLHVAYYDAAGFQIPERLASDLTNQGYISDASAIWVQAYEPDALKRLRAVTRLRRMLLIDADRGGGPAPGYAGMITTNGLAEVRGYAEAIAPAQDLLLDPSAAVFPAPTTLVLDAHAAKLAVFSRNAQAENVFLPRLLQKGDPQSQNFPAGRGDLDKLLTALFSERLDGVATSAPNRASRARRSVMNAIAQGQTSRG